jgi:hypothetical protein
MPRRLVFFVLIILLISASTGCEQKQFLPITQKESGREHTDQRVKLSTPTPQNNDQMETESPKIPTILVPTPSPTRTEIPKVPSPLAIKPSELPDMNWQIVSKEAQEKEDAGHYLLQIKYPIITGSTGPTMDEFTKAVKSWLTNETDHFTDLAQNTPVSPGNGFLYANYTVTSQQGWNTQKLTADYQKSQPDLSADQAIFNGGIPVLSVLFQISEYSGGAHPGDFHNSINYNLVSGKVIDLSELFIPGSDYLATMASLSIANLRQNPYLDDQDIGRGAAPKPENYRLWTITPEGLMIMFEEYQVGPYAAGPQIIVIPFEALKDQLNPLGPLGNYSSAQ